MSVFWIGNMMSFWEYGGEDRKYVVVWCLDIVMVLINASLILNPTRSTASQGRRILETMFE